MKKNELRGIILLGIIAVVYTAVAFAVPFPKNGVFWISYLFTLFSIGCQWYAIKIAFAHTDDVKSKFYGFPIARISVCYMIVQLILSLIFMALGKITPLWVALVIYIVILGAAAVGLIAADVSREEIVRQDSSLQKSVLAMQKLQAQAKVIADLDSDLSPELKKLADAFRFSDPVSSDMTIDIEERLAKCLAELQIAVSSKDVDTVSSLCQQAEMMLTERNQLCKLGKQS